MLTLELHENHEVAIRLHPCLDVLVPSAGSLQGTIITTIDALEKLQKMTFGYASGLWPPVQSSYIYHTPVSYIYYTPVYTVTCSDALYTVTCSDAHVHQSMYTV